MAGHRAQEHIFTIKSVIAFYSMLGKGLILSLFDMSKFFDREHLQDCMGELYQHSVKGKLYRLIYNMNKDTNIRVKTPVGYSDYTDVVETLGQGKMNRL